MSDQPGREPDEPYEGTDMFWGLRSTEPTSGRVFSPEQVQAIVTALHDYRVETDRYLRGSGYQPCHPTCEHCAPKVAYFAEIKAGLEQRREAIIGALTTLGAGPCGCGLRKGEHWQGDHK